MLVQQTGRYASLDNNLTNNKVKGRTRNREENQRKWETGAENKGKQDTEKQLKVIAIMTVKENVITKNDQERETEEKRRIPGS